MKNFQDFKAGRTKETSLTPAQEAEAIFRRKAIYEELHPETKHGANQHTRGVDNLATPSERFTAATSHATGKDERTIRRAAARGEALGEDLDAIAGTSQFAKSLPRKGLRAELTALERDEHVSEWIRLAEKKKADASEKLSQLATVFKGGRGNQEGVRAAARELNIDKDDAHRREHRPAIGARQSGFRRRLSGGVFLRLFRIISV